MSTEQKSRVLISLEMKSVKNELPGDIQDVWGWVRGSKELMAVFYEYSLGRWCNADDSRPCQVAPTHWCEQFSVTEQP